MRKCKGDRNDHSDLEYVKPMFLWNLLALQVIRNMCLKRI